MIEPPQPPELEIGQPGTVIVSRRRSCFECDRPKTRVANDYAREWTLR